MPIIDLLQTFTSRQAQLFSTYLNSYGELRQMKNVTKNLSVISQCILSEYNQGYSKCLNHYLTNEIDKLILQLSQQTDLETFYCSILPLCTEEYLQSNFFKHVWSYGTFSNLARLYAEKCVAQKIFNFEFGFYVADNFVVMKDSIIILCELNDYAALFKDLGLGLSLVTKVNQQIAAGDTDVIPILDLLVYYADKRGCGLLESVEVKLECDPDVLQGAGLDAPVSLDAPQPGIRSPVTFLFTLYKRIRSVVIRQKVVLEAANMLKNKVITPATMMEMLLEFVKIDCHTVFGMLHVYEDSRWQPVEIVEAIQAYGITTPADACGERDEGGSDVAADMSDRSSTLGQEVDEKEVAPLIINFFNPGSEKFFTHVFPVLRSIFNDEGLINTILRMRPHRMRYLRESPLFDTLINNISDARLFALVLFVNETLVMNNFQRILSGSSDRDALVRLIVGKILYD